MHLGTSGIPTDVKNSAVPLTGMTYHTYRARVVLEDFQQEAMETLPWQAIGRKIHQRNPPIQTVAELQAALYQEWVLVTQETNERVFRIMRHGVQAVTNLHVSFVPYCVTGATVTY